MRRPPLIICSPGLTSFGSPLALEDIQGEPDTHDGYVYNAFGDTNPEIVDRVIIHAVDGLQFAARDTLYVRPFFTCSR